jgi:hypothetical protein
MENKRKKINFSTIVEAQADSLVGTSNKSLKDKYGVSKRRIDVASQKINEIIGSDSPGLTLERKIISEAITDRLKPIKEELAVKSLEIIRKTDEELLNRLDTPELIKTNEMVSISDTFSKRFARLTGIEEDPNGGENPIDSRNKNVNIFVQNIINEHKDLLEKKREKINNVYEVGINPETPINKGENKQ